MRFAIFILLAALALGGCNRDQPPPIPPLPAVSIGDVPPPPSPTVTIEPNSNLRAIAGLAYQHENFSGFIALLNGLPDPEKITAGATLKTPSLPIALRDSGLDPKYQPAVNVLAKAWTDYAGVLPAYEYARRVSRVGTRGFDIPPKIKATFLQCADATDAATKVLREVAAPHKSPAKAIGQFEQASAQLRELASGSDDGMGYDMDAVGKRFALGFQNTLVWAQEKHQ